MQQTETFQGKWSRLTLTENNIPFQNIPMLPIFTDSNPENNILHMDKQAEQKFKIIMLHQRNMISCEATISQLQEADCVCASGRSMNIFTLSYSS